MHEILEELGVDARIVYVDIDPVAILHSKAILDGNPNAIAVRGNATDIDSILADPAVSSHLDFTRPVAVLLVAVLHFVSDEADPIGAIRTLHKHTAPGSFLAISHASNEANAEKIEQSSDMHRKLPTPLTFRSKAEITDLFAGFDLVEPGLVYLPLWHPDSPDDVDEHPERANIYAGVGLRADAAE